MAKINGNPSNNTLTGGANNDTIHASGGADFINGMGGDDILYAGLGVADADTVYGGDGNDVLYGYGGADYLTGDAGNDTLYGGIGSDTLDGGVGIDKLDAGRGNDVLLLSDFNGDMVSGGKGYDTLSIYGQNQTIDLSAGTISGVDTIQLATDSNGRLNLTAADVLAVSDKGTLFLKAEGKNELFLGSGWTDAGASPNQDYETFTKDGATLNVSTASLGNIINNSYSISDLASANAVASAFTAGVDEIILDFGTKLYADTGITSINLTGFGLEDKLVIAPYNHGWGRINADYGTTRAKYIVESSKTSSSDGNNFIQHITRTNKVSWQTGASHALLSSKFFNSSTHADGYTTYLTTKYTALSSSGQVVTYVSSYSTYVGYTTRNTSKKSGQISLIGLPAGLPDSHFVFV